MSESLYQHYREVRHVCTDSRNLKPGDIFFALRGDVFDGNRFAAVALEQGASLVVCDNPDHLPDDPRTLLVPNSLIALQQLASHHRETLNIPVIGITGSNGKTTTKELMAAVLSEHLHTGFTKGNLNNHIGVPLTLLNQPEGIECILVEMGANHPGEITFLCHLARPTHGIITNIGKAHLEGFGGAEGVKKAKKELYDYLRLTGGTAFVHANDDLLMDLSQGLNRILYGDHPDSIVAGKAITNTFYLALDWTCQTVNESGHLISQLTGIYNLPNVLAAMTAGIHFGLQPSQAAAAIANYTPLNNRSQLIQTDHNLLIADAYNANPSSMEAALRHFHALEQQPKCVILGDMLELGEESEKEHRHILDILEELKPEKVMLVGPVFCDTVRNQDHLAFSDVQACLAYLKQHPVRNHLVLVKGSRGIRLETLFPLL